MRVQIYNTSYEWGVLSHPMMAGSKYDGLFQCVDSLKISDLMYSNCRKLEFELIGCHALVNYV
jgi:hypothetical protein